MAEVKTVEMRYEGHAGPGGQAFRGRDEALGHDLNVRAGETVSVSVGLAEHLERSKGWTRVVPVAAVAPPRAFKGRKG
jgi:hypothetical protein